MREVLWKENERNDAYHTAKEKERFQIMWANGMHGPEFVVWAHTFFFLKLSARWRKSEEKPIADRGSVTPVLLWRFAASPKQNVNKAQTD